MMACSKSDTPEKLWVNKWLDSVVDGSATMSQRKLSSVEKHGGLRAAKALAREKKVHLVQLEDDKGNELVAASLKPFKVLC